MVHLQSYSVVNGSSPTVTSRIRKGRITERELPFLARGVEHSYRQLVMVVGGVALPLSASMLDFLFRNLLLHLQSGTHVHSYVLSSSLSQCFR